MLLSEKNHLPKTFLLKDTNVPFKLLNNKHPRDNLY